jgi:hypothetical protein
MKEYHHMYVQHLADELDGAVGQELRRQILAVAEKLSSKTSKPKRARILKTVMERMACSWTKAAVKVRVSAPASRPAS